MNVKRPISPAITIADQPTESDLNALKSEGFVGVVNLRHDNEPEQPLSTQAEGDKVREAGLDYLHFGVGGGPLSESGVASVCDFLDEHAVSGKVLVHCRKSARAAALVLIYEARTNHWKSEEVLAKGKAMGLELEGGLRMLVENYLREHPTEGK